MDGVIFQGAEIHHNVSAGVILSDQSLVLQSVTRATAGEFTCMAANSEGRGTSNPVTLIVRCECKVPFYTNGYQLSHSIYYLLVYKSKSSIWKSYSFVSRHTKRFNNNNENPKWIY